MVGGRFLTNLGIFMAVGGTARADQLRPFKLAELLVPDLRLELASGDKRLVVSVPAAYTLTSSSLVGRFGATLVGFVEPQLRVSGETLLRGLAGGRLYLHAHAPQLDHYDTGEGFAPLFEAGGVIGQDGSGGFVGAGLAFGDLRFGVTIAVVGRLVATTDENRADIALDLQFPWSAR